MSKAAAVRRWDESAFSKQFNQFAAAMPAGIPVAGPASGSATYLSQLGSFLKGQPRVKLSTFHAYPLKHCTPGKVLTTSQLLSPASTSGFAQAQAQYVNVSHKFGKLARLDEINGITCGGYGGVSNAFGSALWALDTLFELDKVGVDGVNIQTVPGGVQEIFGPVAGDGGSMVVHPEFYGLMMFAQAAPAGSQVARDPGHATAEREVVGDAGDRRHRARRADQRQLLASPPRSTSRCLRRPAPARSRCCGRRTSARPAASRSAAARSARRPRPACCPPTRSSR